MLRFETSVRGRIICGEEVAQSLRSALGDSLTVRPFEESMKDGPAYPQHLRGADTIAIAHFEHTLDVLLPDFIQRERSPTVFNVSGAPSQPQ